MITGSMFSGKTDELIRRLRRATIARQKVQVFKPLIDDRYEIEMLTSHAGGQFDATPIEQVELILDQIDGDTTDTAEHQSPSDFSWGFGQFHQSVELVEQFASAFNYRVTMGIEPCRAGFPVEKIHAQFIFQVTHLVADCRWRNEQVFSCCRKTLRVDDGDQGAEMGDIQDE